MYPFGTQTPPLAATLNSYDGRVKGNAAIIAAGIDGAMNVYASEATDFILDINGYFVPAATTSSSLEFYPVPPCRVADTRNAAGPLGGPSISGGSTRSFPVQSSSCGIPPSAQAYSLSIAAVPRAALGYLTAWASGQNSAECFHAQCAHRYSYRQRCHRGCGQRRRCLDLCDGHHRCGHRCERLLCAAGDGWIVVLPVTEPCRVIDTRLGSGPFDGTMVVPITGSSNCAPPAGAQAYVLNATVVPAGSLSYLTLWADGTPQPNVSTLNSCDGAITSNMAIVSNTSGTIDAYATSSTDLIFDIFGYFAQ